MQLLKGAATDAVDAVVTAVARRRYGSQDNEREEDEEDTVEMEMVAMSTFDGTGRDGHAGRILPAKTALPLELNFVVPPDSISGQLVVVDGPFGPLRVPVPVGKAPGQRCSFWLGPSLAYVLTVPEGAQAGTVLGFEGSGR